jgi:hypothetical protein
MCVVRVVVFAVGRSRAKRSPTECVVSECDSEASKTIIIFINDTNAVINNN